MFSCIQLAENNVLEDVRVTVKPRLTNDLHMHNWLFCLSAFLLWDTGGLHFKKRRYKCGDCTCICVWVCTYMRRNAKKLLKLPKFNCRKEKPTKRHGSTEWRYRNVGSQRINWRSCFQSDPEVEKKTAAAVSNQSDLPYWRRKAAKAVSKRSDLP
jgi:hypothetical protein